MKRTSVLPVKFSEVERLHLDQLTDNYNGAGCYVSRADLIRYGLSLVPVQPNLPGVPPYQYTNIP